MATEYNQWWDKNCPKCQLVIHTARLLEAAEEELADLKMKGQDGSQTAKAMQKIVDKIRGKTNE